MVFGLHTANNTIKKWQLINGLNKVKALNK